MPKNDIEDFAFMEPMPTKNTRTRVSQIVDHVIYIDAEIEGPEHYRDVMNSLETATPDSNVTLTINSGGGRLDTGLMLINGIRGCQADTTALIHEAGSMATGVALACDSWILGDFSYFMIHSASTWLGGKQHEVQSQHMFMEKYLSTFIRKTYAGFLTTKEIEEVIKGRDMWLDREQLGERLTAYGEYRIKQYEKQAREDIRQRKAYIKELKSAQK